MHNIGIDRLNDDPASVMRAWRAMIDAVLAEAEPTDANDLPNF